MFRRAAVVVAMVAGLSAPVPAMAYHEIPGCVEVPVDTVGAHVEVGDEEVHVPAISNARLCVIVSPVVGETAPVEFTLLPGCGFPCFVLVVEEGGWMVASTSVKAFLTYDVDGVPTTVPVANFPISVSIYNSNPVCVAVGNPIPECPENTLVVPVPAP